MVIVCSESKQMHFENCPLSKLLLSLVNACYHPTVNILQSTPLHSQHPSTVNTQPSTSNSQLPTVNTPQTAPYSQHSTVNTPQSALYNPTVNTAQSTPHSQLPTVNTLQLAPYSQHPTVNTSTVNTLQSYS